MYSGQVSDRDRQVMAVLADTPFADADEVAVFAGLQVELVQRSLDSCRANNLVDFVGFRRSDVAYTRRWCLTGQGVKVLSSLEGATPEEYLREKPVSIEWKRSLLRRLESLDLLYRLLATVAKLDGATPEWVWHRAGIFDATMRLRNGKSFALMRLGTTLSWKATKGRIGTLYKQQGRREAPPALIVVPTDIEALRISMFMARRAIDMYLVSEERLDCMQIGGALWRQGDTQRRRLRLSRFSAIPMHAGGCPGRRHIDMKLCQATTFASGLTLPTWWRVSSKRRRSAFCGFSTTGLS